jgi:hypothetical protein
VEALELGELWDDYGLVGDIVVRFSFYVSDLFHFLHHLSFSCPFAVVSSLNRLWDASSPYWPQ